MPYNNSAIPPSEEVTGSAALPLSRVKRILQLDEDISQCSNNAAFVITVATEMFVRYLAEQAHNVVKSERKPRKNIQYKDLGMFLDCVVSRFRANLKANAVARIDNLEFLSDVIPRTQTYKQYKEKKAKEAVNGGSIEPGQMTLDGGRALGNGSIGMVDLNNDKEVNGTMTDADTTEPQEIGKDIRPAQTNGELVFKHYNANGAGGHQNAEDTEMQ
ncbi:MAG: hypothetical protein M1830_009769 [Pleopsidium flavum]|nr:MAG: hypothetical protein M1830_009769 [Pleopsidium flavum]